MEPEANKEYSVNWKNHMSHVRKAFDQLLNANELTDVTLCCEGRKIGAHKMLLSACSAYFRDTFKEVPSQHPVIILYGVEYSVLSDILHFIYNGEVSVDTSKLDTFLKIAQLLQISGLTDDPGKITQNEGTAAMTATPYQTTTEETYSETNSSPAPSDEAKRGVKRIRTKEVEPPKDKIQRQENDTLFISDVKCEPTELVNFEDPLEDPLQSDQPQDAPELFGTGTSQSTGDEDFKTFIQSDLTQCTSPEPLPELTDTPTTEVPTQSGNVYQAAYEKFIEWCTEQNINDYSENVLLEYFSYLANKLRNKSSTMWSRYSMIKSLLNINHGIDISRYMRLRAFLKKQNIGYVPQKSRVFTKEQFERFLSEASDKKYLGLKIVMIMGMSGGCRCDEMVRMKIDDIEDLGTLLHIKVPSSKMHKTRSFTIVEENFINLYRKYIALRPKDMNERRFFIKYQDGKCHRTVMGVKKIGSVPKEVASFLKLPNCEEYTGHGLRRTSSMVAKRHPSCSRQHVGE